MTSVNLSFSDKVKNQKKYVTGTLWTSLVTFPFVFAYFVLGVIMMISRSINYYRLYNQTDAVLALEKCRAVSRIMGLDSITFMHVQTTNQDTPLGFVFYDENQTVIKGTSNAGKDYGVIERTEDVPEGAKYFRVMWMNTTHNRYNATTYGIDNFYCKGNINFTPDAE